MDIKLTLGNVAIIGGIYTTFLLAYLYFIVSRQVKATLKTEMTRLKTEMNDEYDAVLEEIPSTYVTAEKLKDTHLTSAEVYRDFYNNELAEASFVMKPKTQKRGKK